MVIRGDTQHLAPDRFSRLDVYWIQITKGQTSRQTEKQSIYIYKRNNLMAVFAKIRQHR